MEKCVSCIQTFMIKAEFWPHLHLVPKTIVLFLFENQKRIRIYDMVEEEEDNEDDTLGNSGISSSDLNTSY